MPSEPLISVIIPVYNAESYLPRCVDSVLRQNYSNFEVVMIDDGSTDGSPTLCDNYAKQFENILVKHIDNVGASLARRKGLDLAHGELVSFIDSDDFVSPNYLSAMCEVKKLYSTRIAGCGIQNTCLEPVKEYKSMLLEGDELLNRFFNYEFWAFNGGLYDKDLFDEIEFPKATLSEDYLVKSQLFIRESKMAYIETPLYCYEKHEGSLSNTPLSIRAFDEFVNVVAVYDYTQTAAPQYADLALKNVAETCVKMLLMGNSAQYRKYKEHFALIHSFLSLHTKELFNNKYLHRNVKLIALLLRYMPFLRGSVRLFINQKYLLFNKKRA